MAEPPAEFAHLVGNRGTIVGDHPWSGHSGEIVRVDSTMVGWGVVVRLDAGHDVHQDQECFVFDGRKHWRPDRKKAVRIRLSAADRAAGWS